MLPLVSEKGGRLARPTKTVELRVRGLDKSISPEEIKEAVASAGGCRSTEVKVGQPRASPGGLSTSWVQCPPTAAQKVVEAGTLRVGWVRAPIEVLERRPLQCHRCLRRGHVMAACTFTAPEEDRRGRCFNCGDRGHRVSTCTSAPKCPLCADLGRPANHRLGGRACAPAPGKGKRAPKTTQKSGVQSTTPQVEGPAAVPSTAASSSEGIAPPSPPESRALEEDVMDTT
ncbi:uncharacterized protein LOC109860703 [Pseudomyrmex gracilis]|uniref:uncharacterized protein LOC109860703 n=1 Tax=Pseudomyrmex gracilis TaxID=219809 RepID=UPI000995161D|nr:uncharacterized protein LOC109860703 [Pseudomyrmex gracilis]